MKLLVTGGAGFIGSNFVRYVLERHPGYEVCVLDKLTYAGNLQNLRDVENRPNYSFIKGDICNRKICERALRDCDVALNFAAETHVDRSIIDAGGFVKTDVVGTYTLLDACRRSDIERYIQISTDEVYGSIEKGAFREDAPLNPSSPYSASKGGADLLVNSYRATYGMPVLITRSSNNYGPYQHPEKFIPLFITNALRGKRLPLYGDGRNIRDWLYVTDNCEAIDAVMQKGALGETYNVASGEERSNMDVARSILKELGKPFALIESVKDRPGHDFRYSLDTSRIRELGWSPRHDFEKGLRKTIGWYKQNHEWWGALKGGR